MYLVSSDRQIISKNVVASVFNMRGRRGTAAHFILANFTLCHGNVT